MMGAARQQHNQEKKQQPAVAAKEEYLPPTTVQQLLTEAEQCRPQELTGQFGMVIRPQPVNTKIKVRVLSSDPARGPTQVIAGSSDLTS